MPSLRNSGFTLVELVMVIVVLGILSAGSVIFISQSAQGLVDTSARQQIASTASIAVEKILREVRRALPNSVRTFADGSNQCLEFVPINFSSDYLSIPTAAAAATFQAVEFPNPSGTENGFVAVYPNSLDSVYGNSVGSNVRAISTTSASASAAAAGLQTISLAAAYRFPTDSPSRRFFLVSQPVAFCDDNNGRLWRYDSYGFQRQPDSSASLPATNRRLIADSLVPGSLAFNVMPMTLYRNAVVRVSLIVRRPASSEQVDLTQEVQLRNVP